MANMEDFKKGCIVEMKQSFEDEGLFKGDRFLVLSIKERSYCVQIKSTKLFDGLIHISNIKIVIPKVNPKEIYKKY